MATLGRLCRRPNRSSAAVLTNLQFSMSNLQSSTPRQRVLKLRDPRLSLPTVGIEGAFDLFKGQALETEITEFAEAGYLWAWNIAAPGADRTEWRFLVASISHLLSRGWEGLLDSTDLPARHPADWAQVLALVLPAHTKPFFSAREVKRSLNLRRQHFLNLVSSGAIKGTDYRQGPGGSPAIARASFTTFLESRLVGGL